MSFMQNAWLCRAKDLQKFLLRRKYTRNGDQLSSSDRDTWSNALTLCAVVWYDLSNSLDFRPYERWARKLARFDVLDVCRVLAEIDVWITQSWESTTKDGLSVKPEAGDRFKTLCLRIQSIIPESDNPHTTQQWIRAIAGPWESDLRWFLIRPSVESYRTLHQAFAFLSRVSLRDWKDEGDPFEDYTDRVSRPMDWIGGFPSGLCARLNNIIREWLTGFDVKSRPHHSNGAVAERGVTSLYQKYKGVGISPIILYVLRKYHKGNIPLDEFFPQPLDRLQPYERISRWKQVPKTALKRRSICMEPITNMWFQQMVKDDLYDFIHDNLRHRIDLKDQSRNRLLACLGSITGEYATIDLSAASDSVRWDVVRAVFKGTTLLPWLYATRSPFVTDSDSDRVYSLDIFAPMGSALCFPIECLVFAAVCELAARESETRKGRSGYSVYGDDIVIETDLVRPVIGYLERLGFSVNLWKSFYWGQPLNYRESCGGEYLFGEDVTPVRLPRTFQGGVITTSRPDLVLTHIELANAFYDKGLSRARRWILHRLRALPRGFHPHFGADQLKGDDDRNYLAVVYSNKELQCRCVLAGYPSGNCSLARAFQAAREKQEPDYDSIRLYHWNLMAARDARDSDEYSALGRRFFDEWRSPTEFALGVIANCTRTGEICAQGVRLLQPKEVVFRPERFPFRSED